MTSVSNSPETSKKPSLKRRFLKGTLVSMSGLAANNMIRLGSNLVLTRLLAPEAFGLMVLVVTIEYFFGMLSDIGVKDSLMIRKNAEDPDFLGSAWLMSVLRGLIAGILMLSTAGVLYLLSDSDIFAADSVYRDPRTPFFVGMASLQFVIGGMQSMKPILAERALRLSWVIGLDVFVTAVVAISNVTLAYYTDLGAHALLYNSIFGVVIRTIGSFLMPGPAFSAQFSKAMMLDLFHFGKWLVLSALMTFFTLKGAELYLANYLNISEFGLYSLATIWILALRRPLTLLQRQVAMSAMAEITRDNPQASTKAYYRIRNSLDFICIFGFFGFFILSDLFISIVYEENIQRVSYYMPFVAMTFYSLPLRMPKLMVKLVGNPKGYMIIHMMDGIVLMLGFPVVIMFAGLEAALIFAGLCEFVALPLLWHYCSKAVKLDMKRELILPVFAIGSGALLLLT